jgi:prepilin-type N-terminal cleavage/methylation domain-containing protein
MKKGFTLIEFMIVAALIIMFSGLTLPVGFNFYQESTLKDQVRNLENSLRKAQAMAMTGRGDSSAGVKIKPDGKQQYIIFEGESFDPEERREEADIIIPFPIALSVSGADEIVFQKSTGLPTFPEEERSITITFGANSQEITINSRGKIERNEPSGQ